MRFFDGTTLLGTATVNGAGEATITIAAPYLGARWFSATYNGDGRRFPSISPQVPLRVVPTLTAVGGVSLPSEVLLAAGPNPARSEAALRFALPQEAMVSMAIYDASGRRVRKLAGEQYPAGIHALTWDLRDAAGRAVAKGVYFVQMWANGVTRRGRLVVMD